MMNSLTSLSCEMFDQQTLNAVIVAILEKSVRDGIPALVWMNREIMIAV